MCYDLVCVVNWTTYQPKNNFKSMSVVRKETNVLEITEMEMESFTSNMIQPT